MEKTPAELELAAREKFGGLLRRLREERGPMSRQELARRVSCGSSRIAHVECATQRPTEELAGACDRALNANGVMREAYLEYRRALLNSMPAGRTRPGVAKALGSSLVVVEEIATVTHQPEEFEVSVVRQLLNNSAQRHTQWQMRIAVEGSGLWSPLGGATEPPGLERVVPEAWCRFRDGRGLRRRQMTPVLRKNNPTEREFWLEFRDGDYSYPLYPGQTATIEYSYRVSHAC